MQEPHPRRRSAAPVLGALALALVLAAPGASAQDATERVDFAARYPSTLEASDPPVAQGWASGPDHVWRVDGFTFEDGTFEGGQRFALATGPALVTVGANDGGPIWAVLEPDEPARLAGELAGAGEHVERCFLRFHPAELGALFPGGARPAGDDAWRFRTPVREALRRQANSWTVGGQPMVPPAGTVVLDCATVEGPRRFYMRAGGGPLEHHPAFDARTFPPDPALAPGDGERAFDEWWSTFDRVYAMFGLRRVDWNAVRDGFRPHAAACTDAWALGCVLAAAADTLGDRHAWVAVGGEPVPNTHRALEYRANFPAVMAALEPMTQPRRGINWSRTADGVGYLNVSALDGPDLVEHFDRALDELADARGLIVDLRFNTGGNETFAQGMAGRFTAEPVVYAHQRTRSGPGLTELGPWEPRVLWPRGERFERPTVVLIGPAVMSSAEAFALMFRACEGVTLLGARTAGSSGNPLTLELVGGITATVPQWLAADADRQPFEGQGLAPAVEIDPGPAAFASADPVFAAALARLRP